MTATARWSRPALTPEQVRQFLQDVERDRPDIVEKSPERPASAASPGPQRRSEYTDALVSDLLRGVPSASGPLREQAFQAARSMMWVRTLDHMMESAISDGKGDWTGLFERLARAKELESRALARNLLILEMLRDQHVTVEAKVIRNRAAVRRRAKG